MSGRIPGRGCGDAGGLVLANRQLKGARTRRCSWAGDCRRCKRPMRHLAATDKGQGMSRWSFFRTYFCKSTYGLKAGLPSWSWRPCASVWPALRACVKA